MLFSQIHNLEERYAGFIDAFIYMLDRSYREDAEASGQNDVLDDADNIMVRRCSIHGSSFCCFVADS